MIKITKAVDFEVGAADSARLQATRKTIPDACFYLIAGQSLVFQSPVPALAAFAQSGRPKVDHINLFQSFSATPLNKDNAQLQYQGMASFDNQQQAVSCWRQNQIMQIDVGGEPICQVNMRSEHIHLLNDRSFDDRLNLEVVTGPALIVLLANKGIFCLHAGAVATDFGNIALIAESGVGKSTLSAHLDSHWQQLSDDILPLYLQHNSYITAAFPQLKLPDNTVATAVPRGASINLIIRLADAPSDKVAFRRLLGPDAMLQLVRHTVAAKLFDRSMMKSHTDFAEALTRATPVVALSYPRDITQLAQLREAIVSYLQAGNFA